MRRFFKFFGAGVFTGGLFSRPFQKAFTADETAEGIDLEKIPDRMQQDVSDLLLLSVTRERALANDIARHFNIRLGKVQLGQDVGGETLINIMQSVRSKRVFLICSFDTSRWTFNESLVDLFLMVAAVRRSSPVEVNVILPYYAYSRQFAPKDTDNKCIFAADVANFLETAGADRIYTVNLQSPQIHGAFNMPMVEIDASVICASYFKKYNFKELVLVCANDKLLPRAVKIQASLKKSGHNVFLGALAKTTAVNEHRELHEDSSMKYQYIGRELEGKDVLLIDNIIDTGSTCSQASKFLDDLGAKNIYMFAIHGIFSEGAIDKINESPLKELVVTDTIPIHMSKYSSKINQVSIASMIAEALSRTALNKSLEEVKEGGFIPVTD